MLPKKNSEEEHQANLKEVLRRLAEAGLPLKKDKCNFGVAAVEYLGHRISKDGLAILDNIAKKLLRKAPVLTHYDINKPLLLTCDTSSYGLGGELYLTEDKEQPVPLQNNGTGGKELLSGRIKRF